MDRLSNRGTEILTAYSTESNSHDENISVYIINNLIITISEYIVTPCIISKSKHDDNEPPATASRIFIKHF